MIHLQTAAGDALLRDCLRRKPLLALDFDGTLSPLVPQPAAAAMDPRVPPLLEPLAAAMPVAIVSGRGIADLAARVPLKGVTLVGNHGNEWLPAEDRRPSASGARGNSGAGNGNVAGLDLKQVCLDWAAELAAPLAELGEGIAFESKVLSLSIHYRLMPDPEAARLKLMALVSRLRPVPEIIEGKFVLNLMAPGLVTKYEAMEELKDRFDAGSVIFIGDDVTDERVFERAPPGWLTVRVWDDEANEGAVTSAARTWVRGVDGVVAVLARLGQLSRNL